MIEIRSLRQLNLTELKRVASGYCSDSKYVVRYTETEGGILFDLQLTPLNKPYVKKWDYDDDTLQRYQTVLDADYSFGGYDGNLLVGLVVAEPHEWNQSVSVWEFHVAESYRNMGIGRRLMERVAEKARSAGVRTIVCETQNTNVPAIEVYRKLGFAELCGTSCSHPKGVFPSKWKASIFHTTRTVTTRMVRLPFL
jgi:ribosomal protein S18 acetylase RimI-like enzyme